LNLPFFIARRYLFSKRKKNFINVISILSIAVVAFITAAIIIVLSVFNGLGDLLRSLNNSFDPEIKIEAAKGKSFHATPEFVSKIKQIQGVQFVTEVIEDYAYVRYNDANQIVTLKGVSENFVEQNRIPRENIIQGELQLKKGKTNFAILGSGVAQTLSVFSVDDIFPLHLYYIKNVKPGVTDPSRMYSQMDITTGAIFSIVQSFDENYIIVPLDFARDLLDYGDRRTSIEIKTVAGANVFAVEARLQTLLGDSYKVLNYEEQHKDLYRLLKLEKLFTFMASTVLLGIGSINIFFSLMMLALDKKKDFSVLSAMGGSASLIRNIFITEGALIAFLGAFSGMLLGGIFCWLQQQFGFVSMGMDSSVTEGYPIKMEWTDFAITAVVTSVITFLISFRPAVVAARFVSVRDL